MLHHISIIDDFYSDPDDVRKRALGLTYTTKAGATYPGAEAVSLEFDWRSQWDLLASFLRIPAEPIGPKDPPFPQGKFRVATIEDEDRRLDGVHVDEQPWSGVIYLSPEQGRPRVPAVAFYRHTETGLTTATPDFWAYVSLKLEFAYVNADERRQRFWTYMRDEENWTEIDRVENRYNRALLLNARQFHASTGLFGHCHETGRLTQHFEFYANARPAS